MSHIAGIPLATLFETLDALNQTLPAAMSRFVNRFTALELQSRVSAGAVIHTGRIQSLDVAIAGKDVEAFDLPFGKLKIPMITTGVPFRLAKSRAAITDDLEPGESAWQFDLFLGEFALDLDGLVGADFVGATGTTPRHLAPKPGNPPAAITGSCALRFERTDPDAPVVTKFMDATASGDPFLPDAATGAVTRLTLAPPHVLIKSSQFGLTFKNLIFDYSTEFSPAFVQNAGQSADWMGLAIEECTVYCPSNAVGRGGFSIGVSNLLIGDPAGLQAALEVQFGRSPLNPNAFVFTQTGADLTTGFDATAGTLKLQGAAETPVRLTASLTVDAPPAGGDITDYRAEFAFPGQDPVIGDSASGSVRHGDILRLTPIQELANGNEVRMPSFTVRMVASGTGPGVSTEINGTALSNVVDLTGPSAAMSGLILTANADPADPAATFTWESTTLGLTHSGASLTLDLNAPQIGLHHIKLRQGDEDTGTTHLRLRIRDEGTLLIGCEDGIFDAAEPTLAIAPLEVLGTYDLDAFHQDASLNGANAATTIAGSTITVPPGAIAELAVDQENTATENIEDRHIQILFEYDEAVTTQWGTLRPNGVDDQILPPAVLSWVAKYPGARFYIVGRCDDIGSGTYNDPLAERRAIAAKALLTTSTAGLPAAATTDVITVIERNLPAPSDGTFPQTFFDTVTPDIDETPGRLILIKETRTGWPQGNRGKPIHEGAETVRKTYRRADIYAVGGTFVPQGKADQTVTPLSPTRRQVLVPANDRTPLPAENDAPRADYRVKLKLAWDRPRFSGWTDVIPNLAEFEYAWTPEDTPGISIDEEVLTVFGKYIYDDLTGYTEFTLGIKSDGDDDGLFKLPQPQIIAALTFGPMLGSNIDFDTDAVGSGARLAALVALTGFAGTSILGDGPLIGPGSKTAVKKLSARAATRTIADPAESYKIEITADYTSTIHFNAGALGLRTDPAQPMKVRYKDVGIAFDNTDPDAAFTDKIGFAYASDCMSIEDSGLWKVSGPLGELLRIVDFRMGTSSFWIEPTLNVAIDLGVVEISEASLRVTFPTGYDGTTLPDISLRGLLAKIDIPAALQGEGRLKIESSGAIKASIDVTVTPLYLRAMAALAVSKPAEIAPAVFMNVYARVQFPGGIPLGPLPLAIHGFIGQTVINGSRDLLPSDDVVARELGWWAKRPEDKYKPEKDQHALGLGVVIGTLPDASFSLSATGMVVVAFPDPEVILGVEVNLLSVPDTTAKDEKDGNTAALTGLVVINEDAVSIAVSATYTIPDILTLKVPFAAYFPGSGADTYVRLGSDGQPGRPGEPITITLLPSTLNAKAWSYLMIEGGGIERLGGQDGFDFPGFAIGFGAGISMEWKAGPFELSASAAIYVGFGTDPLIIKGGMKVRGSLDLVVVSARVSGDITVTYIDPPGDDNSVIALEEARFCAEVDLFFFTAKGCVNLNFGTAPALDPPAPPPPVSSVSLTDRNGAVMGEATDGPLRAAAIYDFIEVDGVTQNQGVPPEDNHTVWPDTVPVLNFRHFTEDATGSSGQFDIDTQPNGEPWFGSNRLRYAYRLDAVRLLRDADDSTVTDPSGDALQGAWTHSPSRSSVDTSGSGSNLPSGAEATYLQLLDWTPWPWAHSSATGGAGQPGDPGAIIEQICDPLPDPARACLSGNDAAPRTPTTVALRRLGPGPAPYPSRFRGRGESVVKLGANEITGTALNSFAALSGATLTPGQMVPVPSTSIATDTVTRGYRLPGLEVPRGDSLDTIPLPWRANLDREVTDGTLTLMVCTPETGSPDSPDTPPCYNFEDLKVGAEAPTLELRPFTITALQSGAGNQNTLSATDRLDVFDPSGIIMGEDSQAELRIRNPGASLRLTVPCFHLELHYFPTGRHEVTFHAHHADGTTTQTDMETPARRPAKVTLSSQSGILGVTIDMNRLKELFLHRVCCLKPGDPGPQPDPDTGPNRDCIDFGTLNHDLVDAPKFTHDGATFAALNGQDRFVLRDLVDTRQTPHRKGSDGIPDLQIPFRGMGLKLAAPCTNLEVSVMLEASEVTVTGLDDQGNTVASATSTRVQRIGQTLRLNSRTPITRIEITGGSGEAILYAVCCLRAEVPAQTTCIDFNSFPRELDGKKTAVHKGVTIRPLASGTGIQLADQVITDPAPAPGRDARGELVIPAKGIELTLPSGCRALELHIMRFANRPVTAIGFDAQGRPMHKVESTAPQRQPDILVLRADRPMTTVTIEGGAGESVLYRICCRSGEFAPATNRCVDFKGLKLEDKLTSFAHDGLGFASPDDKPRLSLSDKALLNFGRAGLSIELSRAASNVRLLFLTRLGTGYEIEAFDARGKTVTGESGQSADDRLSISLTGKGIRRIHARLKRGAALQDVCLRETETLRRPERRGDTPAPTRAIPLPEVTSSLHQTAPDATTPWSGQIIASHPRKGGGTCHIVRYPQPAGLDSFSRLAVRSLTPNQDVTYVGLCGIDLKAQEWHIRDQEVRDDLIDALDEDGAGNVENGRPIVLDPDTRYRIEVDWSYQDWQGLSEDDVPPNTPNGPWEAGERQIFRFATAPETNAPPAVPDGANEHIFDPRDLDRYLLDSAPAHRSIAHFTDDPVVFHFSVNHVHNLLDRYDRRLDIEIRRTDPDAQPGADIAGAIAPLTGLIVTLPLPLSLLTPTEAAVTEATQTAPCVEADRPVGGVSVAGQFPLDPNVMYDADLFARDEGDAQDKWRITSANFRTSRYANPREMLEALGCATDGSTAPVPPQELMLDASATVPGFADPALTSDAAFDRTLADLGLDTLALPQDSSRLFQLWKTATDGTLTLEALLIDALEPLNRTAHVIEDDAVVITPRCTLLDARLREAQMGNVEFNILRLTNTTTRALLIPERPLPAGFELTRDLQLRLDTSDGLLIGRRHLRSTPLALELEGF